MLIRDWSSDVCSSDLQVGGDAGHVTECAVDLHMADGGAVGGRNALQRADLVDHQPLDVAGRHRDRPAAEPPQVVEAGMRADRHEIGRATCRERVYQYE